jgi:hypothetical protein
MRSEIERLKALAANRIVRPAATMPEGSAVMAVAYGDYVGGGIYRARYGPPNWSGDPDAELSVNDMQVDDGEECVLINMAEWWPGEGNSHQLTAATNASPSPQRYPVPGVKSGTAINGLPVVWCCVPGGLASAQVVGSGISQTAQFAGGTVAELDSRRWDRYQNSDDELNPTGMFGSHGFRIPIVVRIRPDEVGRTTQIYRELFFDNGGRVYRVEQELPCLIE